LDPAYIFIHALHLGWQWQWYYYTDSDRIALPFVFLPLFCSSLLQRTYYMRVMMMMLTAMKNVKHRAYGGSWAWPEFTFLCVIVCYLEWQAVKTKKLVLLQVL
jgi:hypothetical protein